MSRGALAILCAALPAIVQSYRTCVKDAVYSDATLIPNPFGWPLTPNPSVFRSDSEQCWEKVFAMCGGGKYQSPIDLAFPASNTAPSPLDLIYRNEKASAKVARDRYTRSVSIELLDQSIDLSIAGGSFSARSAHLTTPSLHGNAAAELTFYMMSGDGTMLFLSVLIDTAEGATGVGTDLMNDLMFDMSSSAGMRFLPTAPATAEVRVSLAALLNNVKSSSWSSYSGSMPYPPCHEGVQWVVLKQRLQMLPGQQRMLETELSSDGVTINRQPHPSAATVQQNQVTFASREEILQQSCGAIEPSRFYGCYPDVCKADKTLPALIRPEEANTREWDLGDIGYMAAANDTIFTDGSREWAKYKQKVLIVDGVKVANTGLHGIEVTGPAGASFGNAIIRGEIYEALKLEISAGEEHVIQGASGPRVVAQLNIHHYLFGEWIRGPTHELVVTVPIVLGVENKLLRHLGLPDRPLPPGESYSLGAPVDLLQGLSLGGNFYYYKGGVPRPPCRAEVPRIILANAIEASMDQIAALRPQVTLWDAIPKPMQRNDVWKNHVPEASLHDVQECPDPGAPWSYKNTHCWHVIADSSCNGLYQSPVDLPAVASIEKNPKDNFLKHARYHPVRGVTSAFNGHNFQISNDNFGYLMWNGHAYYVLQMHLHFPSEHTVNGKQYFGEVHIVHQKQHAPRTSPEELLVVAVLFELGEESPFLTQFISSEMETDGRMLLNKEYNVTYPVDLMRALGPALHGNYYRYNGSLTTPPCTESVKWFVFDAPMTMSLAQWNFAKEYFDSPDNNRPTQPLNGRRVSKNSFEVRGEEPFVHDGAADLAGNPSYILGPGQLRNRDYPNNDLIIVYIVVVAITMFVVWAATFVREDPRKASLAGGGLEAASSAGQPAGRGYGRMAA